MPNKDTNPLIEFATNHRTTTHFRDSAILEIRVAYRIMEYLAPDDVFKPKIETRTKDLILQESFEEAFDAIENELETAGEWHDTNCSLQYENMKRQAIELMAYLLPVYKASCKSAIEQRRNQLLEELKSLDEGQQK